MKKCNYCGKEISYHRMYCDDDCQKYANDFYDMRNDREKLFGIINGICVMAIGIGIFIYSILPEIGAWMVTSALLILGVMYFICPIPPDIMIHKYKIKKSVRFAKIVAVVLFVLGIGAALFAIFTT